MSACADLVLDGSPSLGTAGRAMRFDWDIVPGPTNWEAVRQFLHACSRPVSMAPPLLPFPACGVRLTQSRAAVATVTLPAEYVQATFAEGEEYLFVLNVTNHFNDSSLSPTYFSVSIYPSSFPLPIPPPL